MARVIVKRHVNGVDAIAYREAERLGHALARSNLKMQRTIRMGYLLSAKKVGANLVVVEVLDPPISLLAVGARVHMDASSISYEIASASIPGRMQRAIDNPAVRHVYGEEEEIEEGEPVLGGLNGAGLGALKSPYIAPMYLDTGEIVYDGLRQPVSDVEDVRWVSQFFNNSGFGPDGSTLSNNPGTTLLCPAIAAPLLPAGVITAEYLCPTDMPATGDNTYVDIQVFPGAQVFGESSPYRFFTIRIDSYYVDQLIPGYRLVPVTNPIAIVARNLGWDNQWSQVSGWDRCVRPALSGEVIKNDGATVVHLSVSLPVSIRRNIVDVSGICAHLCFEIALTYSRQEETVSIEYAHKILGASGAAGFEADQTPPDDNWSNSTYRTSIHRSFGVATGFVGAIDQIEGSPLGFSKSPVTLELTYCMNRVGDFRHHNTILTLDFFDGSRSFLQYNNLWYQRVKWPDPPANWEPVTYSESNPVSTWQPIQDYGDYSDFTEVPSHTTGAIAILGSCHYSNAWYAIVLEVDGDLVTPFDHGYQFAADLDADQKDLARRSIYELRMNRLAAPGSYRLRIIRVEAAGVFSQYGAPLTDLVPLAAPEICNVADLPMCMKWAEPCGQSLDWQPVSNIAYVGGGLAVCAVVTPYAPNATMSVSLGFIDLETAQLVSLDDGVLQNELGAPNALPLEQVPLWTWDEGQPVIRPYTNDSAFSSTFFAGHLRIAAHRPDRFVVLTVDQTLKLDEQNRITRYPRIWASRGQMNGGIQYQAATNHALLRSIDCGRTWVEAAPQGADAGYWDIGSATVKAPENEPDRGF